MLIPNIEATVLKVVKKEGTGRKSGKNYKFFTATVVDADANVFSLNLADSLVQSEENVKALLEIRNEECELEVKFSPKGFDVSGTIMRITEPRK